VDVTEFNRLSADDASALVDGCLGVSRWVGEVVAGRPYPDREALLDRGSASADHLTDDELASAISRHPRIGERSGARGAEAEQSRAEQAGVDPTDEEDLRAGNAAYEQRFGRVFLIRAAGRSSAEILAELRRRLGNDDATEREETVRALRDIAVLRLEQVIA
jgi:2-oxo-4-hydroxy-4-carboxy-5-ureidoimidazoline decarboxylase